MGEYRSRFWCAHSIVVYINVCTRTYSLGTTFIYEIYYSRTDSIALYISPTIFLLKYIKIYKQQLSYLYTYDVCVLTAYTCMHPQQRA